MTSIAASDPIVLVDNERGTYKVARRAFVDPAILRAEQSAIFDHCWLYLGHASELANDGDFVVRTIAHRSILFTRDARSQLHALLNTCAHRGAQVCREPKGNAKAFQCFYHGWTYDPDGRVRGQPGKECYAADFNGDGSANLTRVPRLECYRDFWFVCFDRAAPSLVDYLGNAKGSRSSATTPTTTCRPRTSRPTRRPTTSSSTSPTIASGSASGWRAS